MPYEFLLWQFYNFNPDSMSAELNKEYTDHVVFSYVFPRNLADLGYVESTATMCYIGSNLKMYFAINVILFIVYRKCVFWIGPSTALYITTWLDKIRTANYTLCSELKL